MNPRSNGVWIAVVWIVGCSGGEEPTADSASEGGQTGQIDPDDPCVQGVDAYGFADPTPLGVSGADLQGWVDGDRAAVFTFAEGGTTDLTLTLAVTEADVSWAHLVDAPGLTCPDPSGTLSFAATATVTTADGAFAETFPAALQTRDGAALTGVGTVLRTEQVGTYTPPAGLELTEGLGFVFEVDAAGTTGVVSVSGGGYTPDTGLTPGGRRARRHDDVLRGRSLVTEPNLRRFGEAAPTHARYGSDDTTERDMATRKAKAEAEGFTAEEKAAMKARSREAKRGKADGAQDLLDAIAAMDGDDKRLAERIHTIVTEAAPHLAPKTWYGMPAYARDGKVVCFFQAAGKFKARYATLGFNDAAALDDGAMWPTAFAVTALGPEVEARIAELVRRAAVAA